MKNAVGISGVVITAGEQEKSQKLSSFLRNASSVIHAAVWLTVSFLFTSIALMLLLVSVMLVVALNIWDKYFAKKQKS